MKCPNCASENITEETVMKLGCNMNINKKFCFQCSNNFFTVEAFIFKNLEMKKDEVVAEILDYLDWNWNAQKNPQANWPVGKLELDELKAESFQTRSEVEGFGRPLLKFTENLKKEHRDELNVPKESDL